MSENLIDYRNFQPDWWGAAGATAETVGTECAAENIRDRCESVANSIASYVMASGVKSIKLNQKFTTTTVGALNA